jgi:hypothetical protein
MENDTPHTDEAFREHTAKPLTLTILIQQLQQVADLLKSTNPDATIKVRQAHSQQEGYDGKSVSQASFAISDPGSNCVEIAFKPLIIQKS